MELILAEHNTGSVQLAAVIVMLLVFGAGMMFIWRSDRPSNTRGEE